VSASAKLINTVLAGQYAASPPPGRVVWIPVLRIDHGHDLT
jgi:hypothetical protein